MRRKTHNFIGLNFIKGGTMENLYIGNMAVSKFESLFTTNYTVFEAPSYSNEPSWDGFIIYYPFGMGRKEGIIKISIQIKGTGNDFNNTFKFDRIDLENYKNNGGVILLVSKIANEEETYEYALSLTSPEIENILQKNPSKSIKIRLRRIKSKNDCIDLCKAHAEKIINLNSGAVNAFKFMPRQGKITQVQTIMGNKVFDGITFNIDNDPSFVIFKTDCGVYYMNDVVLASFETDMDCSISIENITYFSKARISKTLETFIIRANSIFSINLTSDKHFNISLDTKGNLDDVLSAYNFLFSLKSNNTFYIDGNPITLDNLSQGLAEIFDMKAHFNNLKILRKILLKNNIEPNIELGKLTLEEQLYYSDLIRKFSDTIE